MTKRSQPLKSSWSRLIGQFQSAFDTLAPNIPNDQVEVLAVGVYTAMAGPRRRFHTIEHLFRFDPADGLEALAVLYHDVVYWSVDEQWPQGFAEVLSAVADNGRPGCSLAAESSLPYYSEVLAVFGLTPGSPTGKTGTNELFSALACVSALGTLLARDQILAIAACIEATIPFRGPGCRTQLFERLMALGVEQSQASLFVTRAVRMANQDVQDFRLEDTGLFLGGTWNLLPELNPDLRISAVFTIGAYRKALEATDRFFAFLTPELLFDSWEQEPGAAVLQAWRTQAAANLAVARGYLWAKLLAAGLLEALARATGPDVPLSLFMGPSADPTEDRLEAHLPALGASQDTDPVFVLLDRGRSTESSFDLTNSPVAAWIYRQIGASRKEQEARTRDLFSGTLSPVDYLAGWGPEITGPLIRALAEFVPTRRAGLSKLLPRP